MTYLFLLMAATLTFGCTPATSDAPPATKPESGTSGRTAPEATGVNYEHLKQLEWLIGEWESENVQPDGRRVVGSVTYQWAMNRNFIKIVGTVKMDGNLVTQFQSMIGWDASTGAIRNWGFVSSSAGAVAVHRESTWQRQGDAWMEETTVVSSDGKTEKSTTIRRPDGADAFTTETTVAETDRKVNQEWRRRKR